MNDTANIDIFYPSKSRVKSKINLHVLAAFFLDKGQSEKETFSGIFYRSQKFTFFDPALCEVKGSFYWHSRVKGY